MMKKIKRVFLIVLDSCGIGNAPDAERFGDKGADTFGTISRSAEFSVPNLKKLGIYAIDEIYGYNKAIYDAVPPLGSVGRAIELSNGKDTVAGHFEMAGIISELPFPTYPNGFPAEILDKITAAWGVGCLCNKPYSGTEVIKDYGREHIATGKPIVYTSADSVFQIAAHEDVIPVEKLYELCETARALLQGNHRVARVIARPFKGTYPDYYRTEKRHDYAILPPDGMLLSRLKDAGFDVLSVGKISDIFSGVGITEAYPVKGNPACKDVSMELLKKDFHGFCFINLVDFDSKFGHRNDINGYARELSEFDTWLGDFMAGMNDDDALIITADHGCDPGYPTTDHTRETVPVILYSKSILPRNFGTIYGFDKVGKMAENLLERNVLF